MQMKLSEQLKQDHESGDFGRALNGYSERAAVLEDAEVMVDRLRAGNTKLLEALMDMVNQFFIGHGADGKSDTDGEILTHSFMSAEEQAIAVLIEAGMAEEISRSSYRLLWGKLEARKPKRQPWIAKSAIATLEKSTQISIIPDAPEGTVQFYSGVCPATADSPITGELLFTIPLSALDTNKDV